MTRFVGASSIVVDGVDGVTLKFEDDDEYEDEGEYEGRARAFDVVSLRRESRRLRARPICNRFIERFSLTERDLE